MKDTYKFIKDYKENEALRKSLSELAEETYGINFEGWYQSGYWREKYIPYSIVENQKIVSNVSVNIMDFVCNDKVKRYIQLGTVMTDKNHRNKGLSRYLMEAIINEYQNKVDGIYLFANDSVLEFYPKFGFEKTVEYQYSIPVEIHNEKFAQQIPMIDNTDWIKLEEAMKTSVCNGEFEMSNIDLIMFYITSFMQNNVYYIEELSTFVIAEVNNTNLFIHNIFSNKKVELANIVNSFGKEIKQVTFGFTPMNKDGFCKQMINKADSTLFVRGNDFKEFKNEEKMFPTLSHA